MNIHGEQPTRCYTFGSRHGGLGQISPDEPDSQEVLAEESIRILYRPEAEQGIEHWPYLVDIAHRSAEDRGLAPGPKGDMGRGVRTALGLAAGKAAALG